MILRPQTAWRGKALIKPFAVSLRSSVPYTSPIRSLTSSISRPLHNVPSLGRYDKEFRNDGVEGLYTADAFDFAWTNYQGHIVERLNHVLAGDARADGWTAQEILINTAREPSKAHVFNYASMAYNNHFYFKTLSPISTTIPQVLSAHLQRSFTSIDSLRATFLATAAGMFGPGFVWLVQHTPAERNNYTSSRDVSFKILNTYIAGSPLPGAHTRMQSTDLNTTNRGAQSAADFKRHSIPQNAPGLFGGNLNKSSGSMASIGMGPAKDEMRDPKLGGAEVVPVLCVNTWEHAWIMDWGVQGKERFLEKWWDRIDWDVVSQHMIEPPSR